MNERLYTLEELNEAKQTAETNGRVIQSLQAFSEEAKHNRAANESFKRDIGFKMDGLERKIDNGLKNVVTREELNKALDDYVTKDSFEPISKVFYWGIAGGLSIIGILATTIVLIFKYFN